MVAAWAVVRLLGLERGWPLVPLMAFTPYAAVGAMLATALALVLRRRTAAAVAAVAAAALAAGIVPRVIEDERRLGSGNPPRFLTANVAVDAVAPRSLVALVRRERPDVLSVQELTPEYARRLQAAGLRDALPYAVLEPRPRYAGTGLYARFPLRRRAPIVAGFTMARATGAGYELVAVHPPAPLRASTLPSWRRGLRALPSAPGSGAVRILVGDFNATLDHAELRRVVDRGYRDAAELDGSGLRPTWPNAIFRLPPVTIDHVLVDPRCVVQDLRVLRLPDSDHSAVLAEVPCER